MTVNFAPPVGGNGQGLSISISPLGLVELADEEFEVHGPRLNRYSQNWAFYLGHHWAYRREMGEPQVTFNYFKAFTDYILNFTFGRGVQFRSPKMTEAIVPDLLKRVWEVDNDKKTLLWEIGQHGGVSGDSFIKVAYEEAYADSVGMQHPGRVRIIPLNSAYCFPEWHPHDRNRLIRFKLKYRFWGTSLEGTRQVFTYTEVLTDDTIEEYVNDELIDARPNPLGRVPVVHIANMPVAGSPWALADCHDIVELNRQYNEMATDISDIINYHSAPVTVITGAKASQLEKGPKKVWGGLPKDASVFNLELGAGLEGPLAFLEVIKRSMHEMTGVPETALGQMQPISNTSGVALSIMFQPLMSKWTQKTVQYGQGLERVNELVLLTLAVKEPQSMVWDPSMDEVDLKPEQLPQLDPMDPITYQNVAHFSPPLPLDKLVVLNEVTMKMGLGLESREGALRSLGEEFPEEKLTEIRRELMEDAKADGVLQLLKTSIEAEILMLTGMMPGADGSELPPTGDGGGPDQHARGPDGKFASGAPTGTTPAGVQMPAPAVDPAELLKGQGDFDIRNFLVPQAYGTKMPQRRNPDDRSGD